MSGWVARGANRHKQVAQRLVVAAVAAQNSMLPLTFSAGDCTVATYLFGDEGNPAMCPTADPDEGCTATGYLHRIRAK